MPTDPSTTLSKEFSALRSHVRHLMQQHGELSRELQSLADHLANVERDLQTHSGHARSSDVTPGPAMRPTNLRGSVVREDDLVSPSGERWEAQA